MDFRCSAAARRRRHERRRAELAAGLDGNKGPKASELERALHEEINRLPERYRVPIVLCDLEGHSCEEAARRMGRPIGTVKSWRSRGRERLRNDARNVIRQSARRKRDDEADWAARILRVARTDDERQAQRCHDLRKGVHIE